MKKQLLLIVMMLLPMMASADDGGECGDNVSYTYVESTHTLTISGTGAIKYYNNYNNIAPWDSYRSEIVIVIIEDGVTSISSSAFCKCTSLTSVTIGNSVTRIENSAFSDCCSLTSVTIPNSVTSIGELAFGGCTSLTSVTIPNSVTTIGPANSFSPFHGCTNLIEPVYNSSLFIHMPSSYKGDYSIPNHITTICRGAFLDCTGLTSITIPESVTLFDNDRTIPPFANCESLTSVTINSNALVSKDYKNLGEPSFCFLFGSQVTNYILGDDIKSIGIGVFQECKKLTSIAIPNSVTSIGDGAFYNCKSLTSITIPNNLTSIGNSTFEGCSNFKFLVNRGYKSMLLLWNCGYLTSIYDKETLEALLPTELSMQSCTQTTVTFKVNNIYPEYQTTYNGEPLEDNQIVLKNLKPDSSGDIAIGVSCDDVSYQITGSYTTKGMGLTTEVEKAPTALVVKGQYVEEDAKVIAQRIKIGNKEAEGNELSMTGLEPNTEYNLTYSLTVNYGENEEMKAEYKTTTTVSTSELKLETLDPKVIVTGEVIVAAESNITNDEEKVGFEWRRTDAPDEVKSKSGEAFLYMGKMEGYIHNLTSFNYWRFRPYYESTSGNRFYGNWGIIEADDYSYFEPTVHTYDNIKVDGNEAEVKGYVTRGTDEVAEQGFAYWEEPSASRKLGLQHRTASVPADAKTIAASGQVMTAKINGLFYERTYSYVAYIKTANGNTYYGEVQTFTTGETPSGIDMASSNNQATVVARYDTQGRRISVPVKGLNILKMSDGTTKKVVIK